MKASALLAALLLLPASMAPSGEAMSARTASSGGAVTAGVPAAPSTAAPNPPAPNPSAPNPPAPNPSAPNPSWGWPLSPRPAVLRAFDPPDKPWMSGHRGVDLGATHDGVPVTSPEAGTVSFVGVVVDRPVITIDHGDGLRSSFEPVESDLKAGSVVARGDAIGTVRPGHCRTGACVHWGVRRGDGYVNPLEFVMDLRPSILLPADGPP